MTQSATDILTEQRKDDRIRLGLFDVGQMRFGVEISFLSEVCLATELLPVVTTRSEVLGSIQLRGSMIPVLDLMALCGKAASQTPPDLVAIVKYDGRLLGLAVDRTGGISSFHHSAAQDLYPSKDPGSLLVRRSIHDGGSLINIVEVSSVFEEPDMPTIAAHQATTSGTAQSGRSAYLTFEAGGATFGMKAITISGTVPGQSIDAGAVAGSRCLGLIKYHDRDVPAVDCAKLAGLGSGLSTSEPEVVVVRLSGDKVIGLAVDVIRRIEFVDASVLMPPPSHLQNATSMVSSFFLTEDNTQVFILDSKVIENVPDNQDIADLSTLTKPNADVTANAEEEEQSGRTFKDTRRCLVYTAGGQQTSFLTDVVKIITTPGHITPVQTAHPATLGYFVHDGTSVLLVDLLRAVGGQGLQDTSNARVLLVHGDAGNVGFLVESVNGIKMSDMIVSEPDDPMGTVARLGRGAEQIALPFVDLTEIAATVSGPKEVAPG